MKKEIVERVVRKINSVEDLVKHLEKEKNTYRFLSSEIQFTDDGIVIKNYDGVWKFDNEFLSKVFKLIKFYVEYVDYIYSLKKGDEIIVLSSAGKNKAIVKRVNKTKDREIKSITVNIIYPSGFKSEDNVGIKTSSSHCRLVYKGIVFQDLENVVKYFIDNIASLKAIPEYIKERVEKLLSVNSKTVA